MVAAAAGVDDVIDGDNGSALRCRRLRLKTDECNSEGLPVLDAPSHAADVSHRSALMPSLRQMSGHAA